MATLSISFVPKPPIADLVPSHFAGKAWQQVLARDAAADGQFVYAVKTTGIYCKPSCPSRRPTRRNVGFYPSPAAAEAAGFRACLRCEPQRTTPKPDAQAEAISRATEFLSTADTHRSLDEIAKAAGVGKFAVVRGFKRVLGVTPGEFARAQRKERFRNKVRSPKTSVTENIYDAGFSSPSRVYETAAADLGMSPSTMKAGGKGAVIAYAIADSPLDRMLVARTKAGLCAVAFGDDDAHLAAELRERFPQAALRRDDSALAADLHSVLSVLHEGRSATSLPLDVRRTAFQERVWKALLAIPRGETRTYAQIAASVGSPQAVRAVGTACGANPIAVIVPCHRVVGTSGKLTGYRWGTERKRKLLKLETRPHQMDEA